MLQKASALVFLSLASLVAPLTAYSFEVQPMRHSIYPANGQNTGLITVKNTRSKSLPVELIIERRVFGENSEQTQVAADDDFIIFPFQALIEPGATQAFRFQYIGDQILPEETAYTIHVREVPVDIDEGFTGLRYVYSFGVVVYVENVQARSQLSVGDVTRDGARLSIMLENSGTSFARLTNDRITLRQDNTTIELEGDALMSVIDSVVVPPNNTKTLSLDLADLDVLPKDISVSLRETPD